MRHACFCTIFLVFCYTLWHFYVISGTNLLTRCHSASSLFFAVFVFQKSYTGNILEIGWNKFQNSYFSRKLLKDQKITGGGLEAGLTRRGRSPTPGHAHLVWGAPGCPLTMPLHLYNASGRKTQKGSAKFLEQFCSAAAIKAKFRG
jgi:hypothetical protein